MSTTSEESLTPIACNLAEPELRERQDRLSAELFSRIEEVRELGDGYEFRFPGDEEWSAKLLDFVHFERKCCQFFMFEIAFTPEQGPIWLRLRGGEGVKDFVRASMLNS
ncbi:MAG TPA: hypothetical protein VGE45_19945 [Chloroflexia bacterium]|jgi:hypothetical protein